VLPEDQPKHSKTFSLAHSHFPEMSQIKKHLKDGKLPDYVFNIFPPELEAKHEF
jgi:hypothetical protein